MKKLLCLLLLACFSIIPLICQDYNQQYEKKIRSFNHMRSAGWTMAGVGSGFATAGGMLLLTLPDGYWNEEDDYDEEDDIGQVFEDVVQAVAGAVFLGVGVGLLAGGITMVGISNHKVKSYKSKLNNISLGLVCTPDKQGFKLVYRF